MQNSGRGQFDYDVFKAAYDADPKIQKIVTNFDQNQIEFKKSEMDDLPNGKQKDPQAVSKMAKRAVDLGKL